MLVILEATAARFSWITALSLFCHHYEICVGRTCIANERKNILLPMSLFDGPAEWPGQNVGKRQMLPFPPNMQIHDNDIQIGTLCSFALSLSIPHSCYFSVPV